MHYCLAINYTEGYKLVMQHVDQNYRAGTNHESNSHLKSFCLLGGVLVCFIAEEPDH